MDVMGIIKIIGVQEERVSIILDIGPGMRARLQ